MGFSISLFYRNIQALKERRVRLVTEFSIQIKEIDEQIQKAQKAIDTINEAVKPYLCKYCNGKGEESYLDAAVSKDYRTCKYCHGTGIAIIGDK